MSRWRVVIIGIVGALAGYHLVSHYLIGVSDRLSLATSVSSRILVIGAVLGIVIAAVAVYLVERAIEAVMRRLQKVPGVTLLVGSLGLLMGLSLAALSAPFLTSVFPVLGSFGSMALAVILGYVGAAVAISKRDEIVRTLRGNGASSAAGPANGSALSPADRRVSLARNKILDTSVIIDGRVADIARTGFLEGTLIVPSFVLQELQHIADSSDVLKRNRGRRGLDILRQMQAESRVRVEIVDIDFDDVSDVDAKIVRLAKLRHGQVMTNDFNLNKVAELHGVPVLNINELANALKPVVLPGEEMVVHVIRDGKEQGQGIGYLDDGTMVVVDGGRRYIGSEIDVVVTSVLQTSAGRMIFARPLEPAVTAGAGRARGGRETG